MTKYDSNLDVEDHTTMSFNWSEDDKEDMCIEVVDGKTGLSLAELVVKNCHITVSWLIVYMHWIEYATHRSYIYILKFMVTCRDTENWERVFYLYLFKYITATSLILKHCNCYLIL